MRILSFKTMIIIKNKSFDPYFNIAAEEYFIKTAKEPMIMLWRNGPAVIVGVNQNTAAEVNREYCEENGIAVVRRLTGGGAVFHDKGNINYTYIEKNDSTKFSNYSLFTKDIIDYLKTLGLCATLSGRNDVLIGDKKIMGNAQCVKCGNIMHHGCILYSADLSRLSKALNVSRAKIESKGIKSVSSRVVNIADCLKQNLSSDDFLKGLECFLEKRYNCKARELSTLEKEKIEAIKSEKYLLFDWNFGSSPDYSFEKSEKFPFGIVSVRFNVHSGVITDLKIEGDFFGSEDIHVLEEKIKGTKHSSSSLEAVLKGVPTDLFIKGCKSSDLIKLFL